MGKAQQVFLDSTIFFECIENRKSLGHLKGLKNRGHLLITSITVLGEIVADCFGHNIAKLYSIIDLLKELDIKFVHPPPDPDNPNFSPLRVCCQCLDDMVTKNGIYGSSLTDRTHLAYATAYNCDFFLTSGKEPKALKLCPELQVCDLETLRGKI